MRTIETDDPLVWCICQSVMILRRAKNVWTDQGPDRAGDLGAQGSLC